MTQPEALGSRGMRRAAGCGVYGALFWASFAIVEFYFNTVTSIAAATPLALHASMWPNQALLLSWFCVTGAAAGVLAGLIFWRCAPAHAAGISLGIAAAASGFFAGTPQPYAVISAAMIALLIAGSLWGPVRNICRTCLGGWILGLLYTVPLWSALEYFAGMARWKQTAVYVAALAAVVVLIAAARRIRITRELLLDPSPVRGAAAAFALCALGVVAVLLRASVPPDLPAEWRPSAGAAGRPNVVLLIMDSTRADHLSVYGYEKKTTPRLEEIAAEATLFRNAYANSDNSLQSHASMFTGLYPTAHGAHGRPGNDVGLPLSPQVKTMATILAGRGYATFGIAANYFYLHPKFGLGQGFRVYNLMRITPMFQNLNTYMLRTLLRGVFGRVMDTREMDRLQRPAAEINQDAFALLDQAHNRRALPFLLTINYMDVHWPYIPPPPFDGLFPGRSVHFTMAYQRSLDPEKQPLSPGDRDHLFSQYDGSIASLDAEIGRLIQKLKDLGYYDNTLLMVTADHGEMLGEHGAIGHGGLPYQGLVHIPLLVRFPGQRHRRVVDTPVSLVDLLPTVLDLAGIPPTVPMNGMSLTAAAGMTNRDVIVEYRKHGMAMTRAIISGRWKLIQHFKDPALYDIEADPGEDRNLYRPGHEAVGALMSRLAVWSKSVGTAGRPATPMDAETIRRLRSVGYVQ